MVVHFLAVFLPAVVVATACYSYSCFSWHPICLSIAYGFLMAQGILVFSPHSNLIPQTTRAIKVNIHACILLLALAIIFIGQTVIYNVKESKGKSHFTTWHGLLGVITVAYTTVQATAGIFVRYAASFKLPKSVKLADLKFFHGLSGCVLSTLSYATIALGLLSTWFVSNANEYLRGLCLVSATILALAAINNGYSIFSSRAARANAKT